MDPTAIKAGPAPSASVTNTAVTAERPRTLVKAKSWPFRCLEAVASLRLTVTLFALSIFLVYFGTWAQKDAGIWTVVNQYFRSAIVWIPVKVLLMHSVDSIGGAIPYPGGWLLGSLLLANLLAAHAIRFKLSWNRSGVLILHAGLIIMMVGELVTGLFAIEGHMFIMEGSRSNYVEHDRVIELAVVDRSDPNVDKETVVPGKLLERGGTITDASLPFDVEVVKYMANSDIREIDWREQSSPQFSNPATAGIGLLKTAAPRAETAGVETEQKAEMPAVYVTLKEKGSGKPMGTYLLCTFFSYLQRPMDEIVVNGKRYAFALRYERDYRNYSIELRKFSHDVYIGTKTARNYASKVVVMDPRAPDKAFQYDISMNHPLFYRGETFYQADLHKLAKGTILQVVRNPGWWLPYISCLLVSGGMIIHFSLNLVSFLRKRLAT